MSQAYLEWVDDQQETNRIQVHDKIFVGRVCAGVDAEKAIVLNDPLVSRDHAVFSLTGSGLRLKDFSKNGTWINSVRVTQGGTRELVEDDVVRIGRTEFRVHCQTAGEAVPIDEETATDVTIVRPLRSIVTHVVADVRGFTTMSQRESSTTIYELMNQVIKTFSNIVDQYSGTIKDYAGDAVYAFWEHGDVASPQKALLACKAVLRQVASVSEITKTLREQGNPAVDDLKLGWGVSTGEVTVSHYGSRSGDLALVGDSTNLAFRLSGSANKEFPSPVILCPETAKLIGDKLELVDLGGQTVRGREGLLNLYGYTPDLSE